MNKKVTTESKLSELRAALAKAEAAGNDEDAILYTGQITALLRQGVKKMTSTSNYEKEKQTRAALEAEIETISKSKPKPGSPEMEIYLAAGYPEIGTRKHAEHIIKVRETNPMYYPYELELKARAFLEALDAKPSVKDIYHPATDSQGRVIGK